MKSLCLSLLIFAVATTSLTHSESAYRDISEKEVAAAFESGVTADDTIGFRNNP